ncbi:hypothetical protein, partial [Photorhabdus hindustanensis]|uniref:hypothetical protein n=1 Tax=Photorhabdus hindustanensis TaxID=2918802 RepID=UPI001C612963
VRHGVRWDRRAIAARHIPFYSNPCLTLRHHNHWNQSLNKLKSVSLLSSDFCLLSSDTKTPSAL